jgi:predicted component of type VI protein secretion system
LQRSIVLIGRHPECDVRIELPQISRRHCCVALATDRLIIRDLGSQNGVRVNGERVEEARLWPGDEIAIAQLLYRLEDEVPSPRATAVPANPPPPQRVPQPTPDFSVSSADNEDADLIPLDDLYPSM